MASLLRIRPTLLILAAILTTTALLIGLLAPSAMADPSGEPAAYDTSNRILILADSVALPTGALVSQRLPGHSVSITGFPGVTVGDGPRLIAQNSGAIGDVAVVALGYNIRSWDPVRYATDIDRVVESLLARGAKHVIWIGLREPTLATSGNGRWTRVQLGVWGDVWVELNGVLRDALNRHPELSIAEWDDVATDASYVTDSIHLTTKGRVAMADTISRAVLEAPRRVQGTITVPVAGRGGVPADAAAVWLRVTALDTRAKTNVAVHSCDQASGGTQFGAHVVAASGTAAFVPLDEAGNVCVTSSHDTHLTVDVEGWTTAASSLVAAPRPAWTGVIDAGEQVVLDPDTFDSAVTVAVGIEARGIRTNGSVRVFPCASSQRGPTLAFAPNQRSADLHLVAPDGDRLCVTSTQRARVSISQVAADSSRSLEHDDRRRLLTYRATGNTAAVTHRLSLLDPNETATGQPAVLALLTRNAARNGTVRVHSCEVTSTPGHATVTVVDRATTATVVTAPAADGTVCVTAPGDTDLTVNRVAVLTPGQLHAMQPFEVFDSRLEVQRDPTIDHARSRPSPTDEPFGFAAGGQEYAADSQIYVMADSVLLGAPSQIRAAFPGRQVNISGFPAIFTGVAGDVARGEAHLIGDVAVVGVGHNYPHWDPSRFDREIDELIDALVAGGAKHVIWVTLRNATYENSPPEGRFQVRQYAWYFPTVNDHLRAALGRHPELSLADWTSISGELGFTYDAIHLNSRGAEAMANLIRTEVNSVPRRLAPGTPLAVRVGGRAGVPDDAKAAVVRVTATDHRWWGSLFVHRCDSTDLGSPVSTTSYQRFEGNTSLVALDANGDVCVSTSGAAHVVVDVVGYIPAQSTLDPVGLPGQTIATKAGQEQRLDLRPFDSRLGEAPTAVGSVGGSARGVVALDLQSHATDSLGTVQVYPCGQAPHRSDRMAIAPGRITSEFRLVNIGDQDSVCIVSSVDATVSVDVQGVSPEAAGLRSVPPDRVLDPSAGTLESGQLQRFSIEVPTDLSPPAQALLAVRVVSPTTGGNVDVRSCGRSDVPGRTFTYSAGSSRTVHVVARPGQDGELCLRSTAAANVNVSVIGWVAPSLLTAVETVQLWDTGATEQRNVDTDHLRTRPPTDSGFGSPNG